MPVRRLWLPRFTKGLVSDEVGVKDGLLLAEDVVPVREGELWKRQPVDAQQPSPLNTYAGEVGFLHRHGNLVSQDADTLALVRTDRLVANNIVTWASAWTRLTASATFDHLRSETGGVASLGAAGRVRNEIRDRLRATSFGREVVISAPLYESTGLGVPLKWAGSFQPFYNTGTISTTAGSNTVTGVGTTWTSAMVGQYLWLPSSATNLRLRAYMIVAVASATSLTLDRPAASTVAGVAYSIQSLGVLAATPGTFGQGSTQAPLAEPPSPSNYPTVSALVLTQHAGRLYAFNIIDSDDTAASRASWQPDRMRWSGTLLDSASNSGQFAGAERWDAAARRDVFPGVGGRGGIVAAESFNGRLYIFKRRGAFVLQGQDDVLGTDLGATIHVLSDQDGAATRPLSGPYDVAASQGTCVTPLGVIVAGYRGVWLVNEGGMRSLTDGSIGTEYRQWLARSAGGVTVSYLPVTQRVVVQVNDDLATGNSLRTFVYYVERGVWVQKGPQNGPRASQIVTSSEAAPSGEAIELAVSNVGATTWAEDWKREVSPHATDGGASFLEATTAHQSRPKVVTHPFPLPSPGYNNRVRAVLVSGKCTQPSQGGTPLLRVSVVPESSPGLDWAQNIGDDGTILFGDIDAGTQEERLHRVPGRAGTPPLQGARVYIQQIDRSDDTRIYDVGVEVTDVGRIR